jgi:hypothetical protein
MLPVFCCIYALQAIITIKILTEIRCRVQWFSAQPLLEIMNRSSIHIFVQIRSGSRESIIKKAAV